MKMITRSGEQHYLSMLKARLEEQGIPAVIQGEETARMIFSWVIFEPTLWIYINEQYEDAVRLVEDPNYRVTKGVDVEEFYSSQLSGEESATSTNKALGNLALFVIFIMFLLVLGMKLVEAFLSA